ncbi:MAG: hypothetical protein DRZ82_06920 [Thermoprotei archaeon]|nr:MAG: hypothetical protein DRZ82_06920 [Thermoprotei archaeon]
MGTEAIPLLHSHISPLVVIRSDNIPISELMSKSTIKSIIEVYPRYCTLVNGMNTTVFIIIMATVARSISFVIFPLIPLFLDIL